MIYIIGAGGVGSWLTPTMCLLVKPDNVTVIDGDKLEKKNLNRQLFDEEDVGKNKAHALGDVYGCDFVDQWYSDTLMDHTRGDWLLGCVDNNSARRAILSACDRNGCKAIFGANETHSSEAYVYLPEWMDTPIDPRVYYPEIITDRFNDPRAAGIGCTGEAQVANVQLVTANFMAAALLAHLYVVWAMEAKKLSKEEQKHLPYKLVNNLTKNETFKVKDSLNGNTNRTAASNSNIG